MKYKLIALDLDGTLNNDAKVITPKTRAALIAVQKQGVKVALVSGRQAPGLKREADALNLQDYHGLRISYNGGRIQDATTGEIIFVSSIEPSIAVAFLKLLKLGRNCHLLSMMVKLFIRQMLAGIKLWMKAVITIWR